MKNYYFFILIILITNVSLAQWQKQVSGTSEDLNDIVVLSESAAIVVGNKGTIMKTTNNGLNWVSKNSGTKNNFNAVSFRNEENGIAVGSGVVCRTSDGGEEWFAANYSDNFISISYRDPYFGGPNILMGTDSGKIVYSGNDGSTWNDTILFLNKSIIAVGFNYFSPNLHSPEALAATTFYTGTSFFPSKQWIFDNNPVNPVWDKLTGGEFYDSSEFLIGWGGNPGPVPILLKVGSYSAVYSFVPPPYIPEDITSVDEILFVCGSNGKIFKSTDKGDNWSAQITKTSDNLTAISFYNNLIGYSVGKNGTILYTSNGGVTSVKQQEKPKNINLYQNYPNPFNPETIIEFVVPQKENVKIEIFDLLGKNMGTLLNTDIEPGSHKINFDAGGLSSGIYFYRLSSGRNSITKKMVIMR